MRQMGSPALVARGYRRAGWSLGLVLVAASAATAAISMWLFFVAIVVLPRRDPADAVTWRMIAAAFAVYSIVSAAFVLIGSERPFLRRIFMLFSIMAMAFGTYVTGHMVRAAGAGRGFEGYMLIVGATLAGHGLVAIVYAILTARRGLSWRVSQ